MGWNTWHVQTINGMMHLPTQWRARVDLYDAQANRFRQHFTWREGLHRLGKHTGDGRYAAIELSLGETRVRCEFGSSGNRFAARVSPLQVRANTFLTIELDRVMDSGDDSEPLVQISQQPIALKFVEGRLTPLFGLDRITTLTVAFDGIWPLEAGERLLDEPIETLESGGWLGRAADGLGGVIFWNTIWEPRKQRRCTPSSRDGYTEKRGMGWETFLCALMAQWLDPELAREMLQEVTAGDGVLSDRLEVPIGAYCVLKMYRGASLSGGGSLDFLREVFPALLGGHERWRANGDRNGDGLMEWGEGAKAGEIIPVGLNVLYALDAWALAEIAGEIGGEIGGEMEGEMKGEIGGEMEAGLRAEFETMKGRINGVLWNEERGMYQNRDWDGRFLEVFSPTLFYPLLGGIASAGQAERMVQEHLLKEFWGEHGLPLQERVWPPLNFWVIEGLRWAGYGEVAHELARQCLRTFLAEWEGEGHVHKYYEAETGKGDEADRVYTWGGLMAYGAMTEVVEGGRDGWRFGSLAGEAALRHIWTAEGKLSVIENAAGLTVLLEGEVLISTARPVQITEYRKLEKGVVGRIGGAGAVTFGGLPVHQLVEVWIDEVMEWQMTNGEGQVTVEVGGVSWVEVRFG